MPACGAGTEWQGQLPSPALPFYQAGQEGQYCPTELTTRNRVLELQETF